jgi:bacillithiol biosynthesis deacetylase BshB1
VSGGAAAVDLLAFGAHPDDVELCCGGLLALSAARGHRTGIVDLSRGELATAGTPERRAAEAAQAAKILGLTVRENLSFPDGWIHPWSGYDDHDVSSDDPPGAGAPPARSQLARVVSVLRRLRPEVVLVPWTHERHPDHEATSALLKKALFFCGVAKFTTENGPSDGPPRPELPPFSPRQVLFYPMRYEVEPSFVVDISAVVEQKAQAISAYASQLGLGRPADRPLTLIGSPLTVEAFEARDRYHGAMIGVRAGEPYRLRGVLGLADPLGHFRANPFAPALFLGRPR